MRQLKSLGVGVVCFHEVFGPQDKEGQIWVSAGTCFRDWCVLGASVYRCSVPRHCHRRSVWNRETWDLTQLLVHGAFSFLDALPLEGLLQKH